MFQRLGAGGDTTIPSPWIALKQPLPGIGLHDPLHGRQACPEFNSFHQGVDQISPPEGLFSCRLLSKRGQICYIPPQPSNDSKLYAHSFTRRQTYPILLSTLCGSKQSLSALIFCNFGIPHLPRTLGRVRPRHNSGCAQATAWYEGRTLPGIVQGVDRRSELFGKRSRGRDGGVVVCWRVLNIRSRHSNPVLSP